MNAGKFILMVMVLLASFVVSAGNKQPNIVIIYADDMGYGDLNCQNPESKIPTPFLDQLAKEGMRFTDAHSSSGICSPSRYALLTGQYHWRRTHKIVSSFGPAMFRDTDITLPQVLKDNGYSTACIGKWHLGWDWKERIKNEPSEERFYWRRKHKAYSPDDIDWSGALKGGPLDRGFAYYFGDGTINFPPYAWVENDKFIEAPNDFFEFNGFKRQAKEGDWDSRPGPMVKDWDPYTVLPTLSKKAVNWIEGQSSKKPFFLYFALPCPHMPVIPNDEFDGKSEAGAYGDFVYQTDHVAGEVLKALKENGFEKNTIVIFTADNGPEIIAFERAETYEHFSMGNFRGLKRDVWEGGHHIPFIVKWPKKVEKGFVSDQLISQIDLMATLLSAASIEIPEKAAPDSYNFLPLWTGKNQDAPIRKSTVHNTRQNQWGFRMGKWLYINQNTGQVSNMPDSFKELRGYTDFDTKGLLFDMEKDPEQRHNLYNQFPEVVKQMSALLQKELDEKYTADY